MIVIDSYDTFLLIYIHYKKMTLVHTNHEFPELGNNLTIIDDVNLVKNIVKVN